MKKLTLLFIVTFLSITLFSQTFDNPDYNQYKINSLNSLKNAGNTITGIGLVVGGLSTVFHLNAKNDLERMEITDPEYLKNLNNLEITTYTMIGGGALFLSGIIINVIAHEQLKQFKEKYPKLKNISLDVATGLSSTNVTLAINF